MNAVFAFKLFFQDTTIASAFENAGFLQQYVKRKILKNNLISPFNIFQMCSQNETQQKKKKSPLSKHHFCQSITFVFSHVLIAA